VPPRKNGSGLKRTELYYVCGDSNPEDNGDLRLNKESMRMRSTEELGGLYKTPDLVVVVKTRKLD
jgi:hypothetical protein